MGVVDPDTQVTKQQDAFCKAFVLNMGNAADAVRQAKFKTNKPNHYGHELRIKPNIRRRIAYWEKHFHDELMIPKEAALKQLATLVNFNPQDLFDDRGNLLPIRELPKDVAIAIKEINTRDDGDTEVMSVKVVDKLAALEKLLRHYNAFEDHQNAGRTTMEVKMVAHDDDI